jgi:ABC-type branched-subunit amino acid transport system ATPase component
VEDITTLREQYRCPHFRILVIGRANAGKTTILEKVCGVAKGTHPIIICDKKGKLDELEIPYTFSHSVPSR